MEPLPLSPRTRSVARVAVDLGPGGHRTVIPMRDAKPSNAIINMSVDYQSTG
jgi:hypothetical protein